MAKKPTKKDMLLRITIVLAIIVFLGFGADIISLVQIQLINSEKYQQKAEAQQLNITKINAERGIIYDANGKILSQSATAWQIYIVPSKIKEEKRELIADGLSQILALDKEDILNKTKLKNNYTIIKRKVENPEKELVSDFIEKNKLSGLVGVTQDTKRYYPFKNLASTLLGYTGSDDQGLAGIESFYDNQLKGIPGRIVTAKDARQEQMPNQFESTVDAQKGDDIVLTVDEVIQFYLEKNLEQVYRDTKAKSVSGIVMDIKTGGILGMSSKLDFDPNKPFDIYSQDVADQVAGLEGEAKAKAVFEAQQAQWRNHIISDTYEPGSVFKVVTAAAALEEGVITPEDRFSCSGSMQVAGRTVHCHNRNGHGSQTFIEGMMNSCNPVFIQTGQKMGVDIFYKYLLGFGFNETSGIDLPGEVKGIIHKKEKMGISELSSCSFGQSLTVTPLQMINAVAAIANDGKLMEPYLVDKIVDENDNTVYSHTPKVRRQVISEKTADELCGMLELVVEKGTGKNAYVPGYRVAGKTGTSEKIGNLNPDGSKKRIASFCGFAPADNPQVAILIIIDEPQGTYYGGAIAAPVAALLFDEVLRHLNTEPRYTDDELKKLDTATPSLINMSPKEAESVISRCGLNVKIVGSGNKVLAQCPTSGQSVPKNGTVVIYLENDTEKEKTVVPHLVGLTVSEANHAVIAAGLNIKLAGNSLEKPGVTSYAQSRPAGEEVEIGSVITVSFRTVEGLEVGD